MNKLLFIITLLSVSVINAFSLKDKIVNGKTGDYVVTEQGGTTSVLIIRSLTATHLILEEIDVPSAHRKSTDGTWKEWVSKEAPGHTAWITYIVNLKTNQLEECYSHTQGAWLPTKDPTHFLPRLLTLSLKKTPPESQKRVGPPPLEGETDRRSLWMPSVIVEGKKIDKPPITAWQAEWPMDGSLIAGCKIELYFSSQTFPVWIEVQSPHYKVSLRAIDSGYALQSPKPLVFLHSPSILGPGVWNKGNLELMVQCPTYYSSLKVLVADISHPERPFIELYQSPPLESSQFILQIPKKLLEHHLMQGHRYRWVLVSTLYPNLVIYSDQVFQW